MIHDGGYDRNVDTDEILSLLAEWDEEYCMDTPSMFHMREYYVIKYKIHDPDTPTYMDSLSGENAEESLKVMDDEIQILVRRDTWYIVLRKSVVDQNVLPGTCYFKYKSKPD